MSGVTTLSRLERLKQLKSQVEQEIHAEEIRIRDCNAKPTTKPKREPRTGLTPLDRLMQSIDTKTVRAWARANGYDVGDRGKIATEIIEDYLRLHSDA